MIATRPKRYLVAAGDLVGFWYAPTTTRRGRLTKVALYSDETHPHSSGVAWLKPHELAAEDLAKAFFL